MPTVVGIRGKKTIVKQDLPKKEKKTKEEEFADCYKLMDQEMKTRLLARYAQIKNAS